MEEKREKEDKPQGQLGCGKKIKSLIYITSSNVPYN
jgi:hypothetical protein